MWDGVQPPIIAVDNSAIMNVLDSIEPPSLEWLKGHIAVF